MYLEKENTIKMQETNISRAIIEEHTRRLLDHLENDVAIVGAGPAGLTAAYYLAKDGVKTAVFEKRLSIGGGIWGGAAGYSTITVEENDILEELGVRTKRKGELYVADAVEFAAALGYKAAQAGAEIFNLTEFEDIILKNDSIEGIVLNNTAINMAGLLVDPFCVGSRYVIDATGHQAEVVNILKRKVKDFHPEELGEGPMDAAKSEQEVVKKTGAVYPRVYVAGMSVCAVYNIPRMGPIFGGMLKSGKRAAELIKEK